MPGMGWGQEAPRWRGAGPLGRAAAGATPQDCHVLLSSRVCTRLCPPGVRSPHRLRPASVPGSAGEGTVKGGDLRGDRVARKRGYGTWWGAGAQGPGRRRCLRVALMGRPTWSLQGSGKRFGAEGATGAKGLRWVRPRLEGAPGRGAGGGRSRARVLWVVARCRSSWAPTESPGQAGESFWLRRRWERGGGTAQTSGGGATPSPSRPDLLGAWGIETPTAIHRAFWRICPPRK